MFCVYKFVSTKKSEESGFSARIRGRLYQPLNPNTQYEQEDIDYPVEFFNALILGNSPYAFYLFQWVPYQTEAKKWRLKMCHDVKTFDGREAFGIWPNGSSCGPFKDDEVEFIRISKKQFGATWEDPRPAPNADGPLEQRVRGHAVQPPPARVIRDGVSYDTLMPQNGIGKPTEAAGGFVRQGNDVVTCVGCQSMLIRGLNGECKQCGCYWLKNEPLPPNAVKT